MDKAFESGLKDLDGFSHIILLYAFHRSKGYDLMVTPFLDNQERGLFSTRAPRRPNPIGMSVVKLLKIEENTIFVQGIDVLNKTPLLDIKPYVPQFDLNTGEKKDQIRTGWVEKAGQKVETKRADERFISK